MTKWQNRMFRGKALPAKHSWKPAVTICHDSSHSNHVLSTCFTSREVFLRATRENSFDLRWVLNLHTQPIQRNLTYNTGYIRLNRITIKFGTELKPTQISCKSQLYIFIYIWWCMFLHLSLHVLFLFSFYTNVSLCMQSLFFWVQKCPYTSMFK